jgi:hypothetical protein
MVSGKFGRSRNPQWSLPEGNHAKCLLAAMFQHYVAQRAREWCDDHGIGDPEAHLNAAREVRPSRHTIVAKLNGRAVASTEDIFTWVLATDVTSYPTEEVVAQMMASVKALGRDTAA